MLDQDITKAVAIIQDGGVIAYPTEAIYGLGCDPANEIAVTHLLEIKQRSVDKGLILVAANFAQLDTWIQPLSAQQRQQILQTKQLTTWLVPALEGIPQYLTGNFTKIAIRISRHPIVKTLCLRAETALVSTSANLAGQFPARSAEQVREYFADHLDFILDGTLGHEKKPSKIIDLNTQQQFRS